MNFEPQLVGKEPLVGMRSSSALDLETTLGEFRSLMWERAKELKPWQLPTQPFFDVIQKTRPARVGIFFPKIEWAEPQNLVELAMRELPQGVDLLGLALEGEQMGFQKIADGELGSSMGIAHLKGLGVEKPDLVFIPALACDRRGRRLGRGKGYYDRFIATHPDATICATIHSTFLYDELPGAFFHKGDQRVQYVLTEKTLIDINGNEVPL